MKKKILGLFVLLFIATFSILSSNVFAQNNIASAQEIGIDEVQVTSVDGSGSYVNSMTGDFIIDFTIKGENLDLIDKVKLKLKPSKLTHGTANLVVNEDNTQLEGSVTFTRDEVFSLGEEQTVALLYKAEDEDFVGTGDLRTSSETSSSANVNGYVSEMNGNSKQPLTVSVTKETPSDLAVYAADGSSSYIDNNGNFAINFSLDGKNLDQISKVKVKLKPSGELLATDHFLINSSKTNLTGKVVFDRDFIESLGEPQYVTLQYKTKDDEAINLGPLHSRIELNDTKLVNGYTSTMTGDTSSPLEIDVQEEEGEHSTVESIDGSNSYVDPQTGNFIINFKIEGENLEDISSVRINVGSLGYTSTNVFTTHTAEKVIGQVTIGKTFVTDVPQSIQISYAKNYEPTYTVAEDLMATTPINDSKTISGYTSTMTGSETESITISTKVIPPSNDLVINTIDGKGSYIDDVTGNFIIQFKVNGENLDKIDKIKIKLKPSTTNIITRDFNVNEDHTTLAGSVEFDKATIKDLGEAQEAVLLYKVGEDSFVGAGNLTTTTDINDEQVIDGYKSTMVGDSKTPITIEVIESTEPNRPSLTSAEGKNSVLTEDGEANYKVTINGTSLLDVNKVYFRTVTDSTNVVDSFTIDSFVNHTNSKIAFNLEDNSKLLTPNDYLGKKVYGQVSLNGVKYFDIVSSEAINEALETENYTIGLNAEPNGLIYYEVGTNVESIFELQEDGSIISYNPKTSQKVPVYWLGSKEMGAEGLAWDETNQRLFYSTHMHTDGLSKKDYQDIYLLSNPIYENDRIEFQGKLLLYENLIVKDAYKNDTQYFNEGATYNKISDSYEFVYKEVSSDDEKTISDIKVSYAANGSGISGVDVNLTNQISEYGESTLTDIAYDHTTDQYIYALTEKGVMLSDGTIIDDGKADGLAIRGNYLYVVDAVGKCRVYELGTYDLVQTLDNLPKVVDAA